MELVSDRVYEVLSQGTKQKKQGMFGAEEFRLEMQDGEPYLRCPGGELLRQVQAAHEEGGTVLETFRGKPRVCHRCEVSSKCRSGQAPRTVKRNVYAEDVKALEEKMKQPEARVIMGVHRAAAEGAVGEMKHHRLLDRARQKGLARLMYQAYLSAIVTNTKRLVRVLEEKRTQSMVS